MPYTMSTDTTLDKDRDQKILDNIGLVYKCANRTRIPDYAYFSKEDIIQQGTLGLIHAVDNYNEEYNCKFSSYAISCIQGYILTYVREQSPPIHTSRSVLDKLALIYQSGYDIVGITDEEASSIGISTEDLYYIKNILTSTSLSTNISEDDDSITLMDMIEDDSNLIDDIVNVEGLKHLITQVIDTHFHEDDQKDIIYEYYFTKLYSKGISNRRLADKYNTSQTSVNRYINRSRRYLYKELERQYGEEYVKDIVI